jgi:hypothetical protein
MRQRLEFNTYAPERDGMIINFSPFSDHFAAARLGQYYGRVEDLVIVYIEPVDNEPGIFLLTLDADEATVKKIIEQEYDEELGPYKLWNINEMGIVDKEEVKR